MHGPLHTLVESLPLSLCLWPLLPAVLSGAAGPSVEEDHREWADSGAPSRLPAWKAAAPGQRGDSLASSPSPVAGSLVGEKSCALLQHALHSSK